MSAWAPTVRPWMSAYLRAPGFDMPPMQLSIAAGILHKRFEDRYGYEPTIHFEFIGEVEVGLYMCFDQDMDILLEALIASRHVVDGNALLRLRPSTCEAASAA